MIPLAAGPGSSVLSCSVSSWWWSLSRMLEAFQSGEVHPRWHSSVWIFSRHRPINGSLTYTNITAEPFFLHGIKLAEFGDCFWITGRMLHDRSQGLDTKNAAPVHHCFCFNLPLHPPSLRPPFSDSHNLPFVDWRSGVCFCFVIQISQLFPHQAWLHFLQQVSHVRRRLVVNVEAYRNQRGTGTTLQRIRATADWTLVQ